MLSARQDLVKRGHRLRSALLMKVSCIQDSRMYTRAARNAYTRARMLVGAACYTEVLYRLTVGNRREAEESLSGAAAWLWLSYIINLSLSASLPLPRIPVLSPPPSLSLSLSLSFSLPLAHSWPTLVVAFRFCSSSHSSPTSSPVSSVCRCCSARPAIYASVESVRCCGQLPRFKENQELRPRRETRPPLALLVSHRYLPVIPL